MSSSRRNIVTFYSYKGGTGRSMALANVAWVLASTGARVLVVDWDLEAPGLHRYFRPFLADKELVRDESEGVIDFVLDFAERMATPERSDARRDDRWFERQADISKWSKQLLWPSGEDALTQLGGSIHFVPAGRQGPAYGRRVNSFDWSSFYQKYRGGAFIDAMRRHMATYDWVLIDSRTGVSDTSGICTRQLPDTLVVCFTLNFQSIDGAAAVAASAREGRESGLRILPLPTRLDGSEDKLLRSMLTYARDLFDPLMESHVDRTEYWRKMGIPYFPRYAYAEKLAPFEEHVSDTTSTLPAIERLTSYVTEGRVQKMEPLPEPHRAEALAEFERLPGSEAEFEQAEARTQLGVPALASPPPYSAPKNVAVARARYWAQRNTGALALGTAAVLMLAYVGYQGFRSAPDVATRAVSPLIAGADAAFAAGQRAQAALLIAEAAGRLDSTTVVGPDGEPGSQIYQALMKLNPLVARTGPQTGVQIGPDGLWLVATSADRSSLLFRFPPQGRDSGRPAGYSVAAFSPDSRYLATGGRNGSLMVEEIATGRRVAQWENPNPDSAWVTAIGFSPSGERLVAGTDSGTVVELQAESWKVVRQFEHQGGVDLVAFSPDSRYVAAGGRRSDVVGWWSDTVRAPVVRVGPIDGGATAIAVQASSRPPSELLLTVSQRGALRVWDLSASSNAAFRQSAAQTPRATPLAAGAVSVFSPNAELLATGPAAALWKVGSSVARAGGVNAERVQAFAFSADGSLLATGDDVGQVMTWRITDSAEIGRATVPGAISSMAIGGERNYVAVASADGAFVMLPTQGVTFSAAQVKGFACSQVTEPQLSAADWQKYFGDEPLRFTCEEALAKAAGAPSAR